jgi:hypothetical protein
LRNNEELVNVNIEKIASMGNILFCFEELVFANTCGV